MRLPSGDQAGNRPPAAAPRAGVSCRSPEPSALMIKMLEGSGRDGEPRVVRKAIRSPSGDQVGL
jgi:hypothetical protein